ncbi:MAG: hypothetical protein EU529_01070 [Promethearchaeota archaeon]|nr:MAG: hypothetical protein EU529_01070 [Candidatus Lokiarchaeota archaeon]
MSNFSELILHIFEHKPIDRIIWQPRIMYWYFSNQVDRLTPEKYQSVEQFVPKEYIGKSIKEVYKDINASIRYPEETFGFVLFNEGKKANHQIRIKKIRSKDKRHVMKTITPVGEVSQIIKEGRILEFPVKKIEDLKVIKYIEEQTDFMFNEFMYEKAKKEMQDFGIPTSYYFRSPYMKCVLSYLGLERTIIYLRRYKTEMEDFFHYLEELDLSKYKRVITKCPLKLLNFGENIDHNISPPPYFEKYLLEYYETRVKLLHNVNKFAFIHIDGSFKHLLPYLPSMSFDGYEALTPPPQGDVPIESIAKTIGESGKILLDGIPATLFLRNFEESKLIDKTKKILELFSPNLILGISDELCHGDGRRLKTVSRIVDKFEP